MAFVQAMARSGPFGIIRSLLRKRDASDKAGKDSNGLTALHRAAQKGEPKPATSAAFWQDQNAATAIDKYGRMPMHCAAENGHVEIVQALIRVTDVDSKDNFGRTALHWAADNDHFPVVELLLGEGADINLQDFSNQTALSRAVWRGRHRMTRYLLEHGAAYHVPDRNGKTALDLAVDKGDLGITELFLTTIMEKGENGVNAPIVEKILWGLPNDTWRIFYGRIMLWAARNKHRTVMELLLKRAIQVDDQFEDVGESVALRPTAGEGHLDAVAFLLESIPNSATNPQEAQRNLQTALSRAILDGQLDAISCLLEAGVKPTEDDFYEGVQRGHLSIVNRLLEAGAKPTGDDLSEAAELGHLSIVNRLLEAGVKPTKHILSEAAEAGHLDIVNRLLEAGAKPTNYILLRPVHKGHLDIVNRLLEAGAKPIGDDLSEAAEEGHLDIVKCLLQFGVKPTKNTITDEFRSAAHRAASDGGPKASDYSEIENRIREALALKAGE